MTHIIVMAYISLAQISDFEEQTETVVINNLITEHNDSGNIILVKADITNKYYKTIGPIRVSLESRSKDGKFRRVEDKRVSNLSTGYPKSVEFNVPQDIDKEDLSINVYYRTTLLSKMVVKENQNNKNSEMNKLGKSTSNNTTLTIFGYMLGSKITDWKNAEKINSDVPEELLHSLAYKIKDADFSSTLKKFDHLILVQKSTSLAYEIEFTKYASWDKLEEVEELDDIFRTLYLGLKEKYGNSTNQVTDKNKSLRSVWFETNSGNVSINMSERKVLDNKAILTLTYTIKSIEKDVQDQLSEAESKKPKKDYSKEVP